MRLGAALAGAGEVIHPEHLTDLSPSGEPPATSLKAAEQRTVEQALHANRGNISATANQLGISRTTLYKKLKGATEL